MAARRLIIVLLVLFAISIAAAAVAPQRDSAITNDDEETTSSTTEAEPDPGGATGGTVAETIDASKEEPETVRVEIGDQLELTVSTDAVLQVELAELGLLENATPEAPAQLNILLREAGELAITDALSGDVIGRLLVEEETSVAKPDRSPPGGERGAESRSV